MAKTSKSDITRHNLIEAAHHVYLEKGYCGTKVVDIIKQAGCGHGTFYDYFKSKDHVLIAILDDLICELDRLSESSRILMERIAFDDYEAVRIILRGISDIFERHGDLNNVYIEAAIENQTFKDLYDDFHRRFSSILENKVLEMKQADKCHDIDPRIASQILVTLIGFTAYARNSGIIDGDNGEVTENLALLIFRALNY
ncbi:MAG: TetR/AcrR family transcriptional regulator [Actinomycetota bacterium]|nr:TetR/AcrR family transcriptional regulator [Actinomycetota bacterium]